MATWTHRPITPVYWNESNRYRTYPAATGEDFEKGSPVVMASNEISETGADPASIFGFVTSALAGYDWQSDTFGHVNKEVPVALADQTFRGTLKGTYAAADVGTEFGLVDDGGTWVVDRSDTSNTRVVVIDVGDDNVEVGDVDPPVIFTVLAANQQVVT